MKTCSSTGRVPFRFQLRRLRSHGPALGQSEALAPAPALGLATRLQAGRIGKAPAQQVELKKKQHETDLIAMASKLRAMASNLSR